MKYLLCLLALVIPSISLAQQHVIGVYADEFGSFCSISDVPGPRTLYVFHSISNGATGSRFAVEYSSGFTGLLLSSSSPFSNVSGDPLSGITVMYDNTCQLGTFLVLALNFMLYGGSPDCSWVRTRPDPASPYGVIEIYDCNFESYAAHWEGTHVYSPPGFPECPNDSDGEITFCRPYWEPTVSTQASTWGAVKALYR